MAPVDGINSSSGYVPQDNNSSTYDPLASPMNISLNYYINLSDFTDDPLQDMTTEPMEEAKIRNKHQMYIWLIVTGVLCAAVIILWIINVTVFNGGMVRRSVARRCGCRCCGASPDGKGLGDPLGSGGPVDPGSSHIPDGRFVRRIESVDRGANTNVDGRRGESRRKGLIWAGFRHNLPAADGHHS